MQKAAQLDEHAGGDLSTLLRAWSGRDQGALARLAPIVYDELHCLARRHMKGERPGHSLQTAALVHEAYMRFFGGLSVEETAEVLKVSSVTVMRDWSTAKAWLYRELAGGTGDGFRTVETSR